MGIADPPPAAGAINERMPARSLPARPFADCSCLVIGAGIIGVCTAYELARAGVDVMLVERAANANAEASGGNAGSLHVQTLSYAFPDFEAAAAQNAFAALPLQQASAVLWSRLAEQLDDDIELKIGGGLCLAHDAEDVRRLKRKTILERASGSTSSS